MEEFIRGNLSKQRTRIISLDAMMASMTSFPGREAPSKSDDNCWLWREDDIQAMYVCCKAQIIRRIAVKSEYKEQIPNQSPLQLCPYGTNERIK